MITNFNRPRLKGGWIIFDSEVDVFKFPIIINYNPPRLSGGVGLFLIVRLTFLILPDKSIIIHRLEG